MVRIRLRRVGSRHQPSYRLIVADEESPRDGRFLENLGHHNPRPRPEQGVASGNPDAMKGLIEYVAKSLVDDPTEVRVTERTSPGEVQLELEVAPEDMGRVIGRAGRVASAMRMLLRVAAVKHGVRVTLAIRCPRGLPQGPCGGPRGDRVSRPGWGCGPSTSGGRVTPKPPSKSASKAGARQTR